MKLVNSLSLRTNTIGDFFNPSKLDNTLAWWGPISETQWIDQIGKSTREVKGGYSYNFPGNPAYIDSGYVFSPSGDYEVSCWFKTLGGGSEMIANWQDDATNGGFLFKRNSDRKIQAQHNTNTLLTVNTYDDNVWYKAILNKTGTTLTLTILDVNGDETETPVSTTITISAITVTNTLWVGEDHVTAGNFWDGNLKDLQITEAGVTTLHYKMEEESGELALDSSGNERHGEILNATLSTFHDQDNTVPVSYGDVEGYGSYMYGNGTSQHVSFADNAVFTHGNGVTDTPFSIYFEGFFSGATTLQGFWGKEDEYQLSIDGAGNLTFQCFDTSDANYIRSIINGFGSTYLNKYIRLLVTYDGGGTGGLRIFVNGQDNSITGTPVGTYVAMSPQGLPFTVYQRNNFSTQYISGVLHNVKLWDSEISESEAISITNGNDPVSVPVFSTLGNGNVNADWTDQIGGNNGSVIGSPDLLYAPKVDDQDIDAFEQTLKESGRVKYNLDFINSNCLTFDGVDDYVDCNTNILPDDTTPFNIKISFLCSLNDAQDRPLISQYQLGQDKRVFFFFVRDGELRFFQSNVGVLSIGTFNTSDVNNAEIDFDGTTLRTYLNGVEGPSSTDYDGAYIGESFLMGAGWVNSGQTSIFNGSLFDLQITVDGVDSGFFSLAEGSGNQVFDKSPNNIVGTLENFTLANAWGTTQDVFHGNIYEGHSQYMDFNGVDTYVETGPLIDNVHDFDVTFNLVSSAESGSKTLYSQASTLSTNQLFYIRYDNDNIIDLIIRDDSNTTYFSGPVLTTALTNGTYQKIRIVNDNGNITGYLDDVEDFTGSYSTGGTFTFNRGGFGTILRSSELFFLFGILANISITSNGTLNHTYNGNGIRDVDWLDNTGSSNGVVNGAAELLRLPRQIGTTNDVFGEPLSNPAVNGHNNAETELEAPQTPEMMRADDNLTTDYWFDSGLDYAPNPISWDDIVGNIDDQLLTDVSNERKKINMVFGKEAYTGDELNKIKEFTNNEITRTLSYTGNTFSVAAQDNVPLGLYSDGSFLYVVGNQNDTIYQFTFAGSYTGFSFSVGAQETIPFAMTSDGSFYYVIGNTNETLFQYTLAGSYTGTSYNWSAQDTSARGVTFDGTFFWFAGDSTDTIYQYNSAGVYTGFSFSIPNGPVDLVYFEDHLFVLTSSDDNIYKYDTSGNQVEIVGNISAQTSDPRGLSIHGDSLEVLEGGGTVYLYDYS